MFEHIFQLLSVRSLVRATERKMQMARHLLPRNDDHKSVYVHCVLSLSTVQLLAEEQFIHDRASQIDLSWQLSGGLVQITDNRKKSRILYE
jgi:hypothetical protein